MTGRNYILGIMNSHKPVQSLPDGITVIFSDVSDGSIAAGAGNPSSPQHEANIVTFLRRYGLDPSGRTKVFVTYGPENTYTNVERVTSENAGAAIVSDALYTTDTDRLITLPVADCIATVIYDPVAGMMGVLHLGRHASVAGLIETFIIEVADTLGSDPRDWHVWMSPSLKKAHDIMEYFDPPNPDHWKDFVERDSEMKIHIDIDGHNQDRFIRAGVIPENIIVSPEDTYSDERYYSNRAANELNLPDRQGRMMVAAIMTKP